MEIDPTIPQDDKAQRLFILCGINPADKKPYALINTPAGLKIAGDFEVHVDGVKVELVDPDNPLIFEHLPFVKDNQLLKPVKSDFLGIPERGLEVALGGVHQTDLIVEDYTLLAGETFYSLVFTQNCRRISGQVTHDCKGDEDESNLALLRLRFEDEFSMAFIERAEKFCHLDENNPEIEIDLDDYLTSHLELSVQNRTAETVEGIVRLKGGV